MNKNDNMWTMWLGIAALLIIGGGIYYFSGTNNVVVEQNIVPVVIEDATSTQVQVATNTNSTTPTNGAKVIGGYPISWPADVPKYPNGKVIEKGGNNPKSLPTEAVVVFTTADPVKTVVNFYLKGLVANGWKITEDGSGTANMTTFRASKGKRSVGGYAVYENGKTEVSLGVNVGM